MHSKEFIEPERQIFLSMSKLLDIVGLDYQGGFIDLGDHLVHYLDYGEGPPVLMLHGGGAGSAIWFKQIQVLSKTRRVIAPDHPVFGLSSQDAYKAPFLPNLVTYMVRLFDELGLNCVDVVGLSMGAQAALAMALEHPDRLGKLVVIDSAGLGRDFPLIFKLATVPLFGRLIVRPNRWGQDNYFKTMEVVNSDFTGASAYKQYAYDVTLPDGHGHAMRSSLAAITNILGQKSIFTDEELASISAPTLALWGAEDRVFPLKHGYRLAQLLPNVNMHIIDGARHVPFLDHPDTANDLITGFLNDP
jgi:pimeloyl-ACP methyl ester carboxylesterase